MAKVNHLGRWAAWIAAGVIGVGVATLPWVPAGYAAAALSDATQERLRLVQTHGTVWSGGGQPVLRSGGQTEAVREAALPPIQWRVVDIGLWPLHVRLAVSGSPALSQSFEIDLGLQSVQLTPGKIELAADLLAAAGAPLNTVKPGGRLILAWDTLSWQRSEGFQGKANLDWIGARSAISPIAPLGDYRIVAVGEADAMAFTLSSVRGPLLLSGQGRWSWRAGLSFQGLAQADAAKRAELKPLIGLLGRSTPDGAQLRI